MLTGETLFPAEDHVDLLNRIVKLCGKPSTEEISDYISEDVRQHKVHFCFLLRWPSITYTLISYSFEFVPVELYKTADWG